MVRGYSVTVDASRALFVPRPLVKLRSNRTGCHRLPERPGPEAAAVGMDPGSQAKKLMFWQVNVTTAGEVSVAVSIGPLAAMGFTAHRSLFVAVCLAVDLLR